MRWFKHLTDSSDDEKLACVLSELGPEGYGVWWLIVEAVAKQIGPKEEKTSASYSVSHWIRIARLYHHKRFKKIIETLVEVELILARVGGTLVRDSTGDSAEIDKRLSEKTNNLCTISALSTKDVLTISIPNILKYRDEYSKKSGQTPESVRSKKEKERQIQKERQIKPTTATASEVVFRETFDEKHEDLKRIFPHCDFEVERELCIAHYRTHDPPIDPYVVIVKWFKRIEKEPRDGRSGNNGGAAGARTKTGIAQSAISDSSPKPAGYFAGDFEDHSSEW